MDNIKPLYFFYNSIEIGILFLNNVLFVVAVNTFHPFLISHRFTCRVGLEYLKQLDGL